MRHSYLKIGSLLAVAMLLGACGESPAPGASNGGKPAAAADAEADALGDKRALIATFTPLPLADRQQYRDAMAPLVLVDLYQGLKPAEESDVDVADSLGGSLDYAGFPQDVIDVVARYSSTSDGFKKRDIAKEVAAVVAARKLGETDRRVLVSFAGYELGMGPYDFERKGFPFDSTLLLAQQGDVPSSWVLPGMQRSAARSYLSIPPNAYQLGIESEGLGFLRVEDEATARVIEAGLDKIRVNIYGSVVRVYRDYDFKQQPAKASELRYVQIQPQRIDLVDDTGKVVFTAERT